MLDTIRKLLDIQPMSEVSEEFSKMYPLVVTISVRYLDIWFKQYFNTPEWKEIFADKPNISSVLAMEVVRYLLCLKVDDNPGNLTETDILAKQHREKWADDVMKADREFCELIVQTLRMYHIVQSYITDSVYITNSSEGEKIQKILDRYGGTVLKSPTPRSYRTQVINWMEWYNEAKKKGLISTS